MSLTQTQESEGGRRESESGKRGSGTLPGGPQVGRSVALSLRHIAESVATCPRLSFRHENLGFRVNEMQKTNIGNTDS